MTRIGVFGSAFNPPHIGHMVLLEEARWRLGLDRVIVVPTGNPYHKNTDSLPDPDERLALVRAAVGDLENVEVSDVELNREGPSYTCDTLEAIRQDHPDAELLLLLGADAAMRIASWHRLDRVLELARIAVVPRGHIELGQIERAVVEAGGADLLEFFSMPQVEVSSSMVRTRLNAGQPFSHLVPDAVARMIEDQEIYGS